MEALGRGFQEIENSRLASVPKVLSADYILPQMPEKAESAVLILGAGLPSAHNTSARKEKGTAASALLPPKCPFVRYAMRLTDNESQSHKIS